MREPDTCSLQSSMTQEESMLGQCPKCEAQISAGWLLIEYEKSDGSTGIWAECHRCGEIVAPK